MQSFISLTLMVLNSSRKTAVFNGDQLLNFFEPELVQSQSTFSTCQIQYHLLMRQSYFRQYNFLAHYGQTCINKSCSRTFFKYANTVVFVIKTIAITRTLLFSLTKLRHKQEGNLSLEEISFCACKFSNFSENILILDYSYMKPNVKYFNL